MRRLLAGLMLLALAGSVQAQFGLDCSSCSSAEWGENCGLEGNCGASNPNSGCGGSPGLCCSCFRGFTDGGEWFGGHFDKSLFIVDVPGPLSRVGVEPGDCLWATATGRGPKARISRPRLVRLTPNRPGRGLRVTVYRRATGEWFKRTID